jgi:hypothetical protein
LAYTSNIREFSSTSGGPISTAYRLLVAIELALKDAGLAPPGTGGHDIPSMLANAALAANAAGQPFLSGQLSAYSAQLTASLGAITCTGLKQAFQQVPSTSFPYIRYTRVAGEWGGTNETPNHVIKTLEMLCQTLFGFLLAHGKPIGVKL